MLRMLGSALAYLHDMGQPHGDVSPESVWMAPAGRMWLLGWQWSMPRNEVPTGLAPASEQGGTLVHPTSSVRVRALPDNLPETLHYDISGLVDYDTTDG